MIFKDLRVFLTLVFFFLSLSFFDLLGLGIIVNFITLIINPDTSYLIFFNISNSFLEKYSFDEYLLIYALIIIIIFVIKNILSIYFNYYVLNFSLNISKIYRIKMINKIFLLPFKKINQLSNAEVIKILGENISNFEGVIQSIIKLTSDIILIISIIIFLAYIELKSLLIIGSLIFLFTYLFNLFFLSKLKKMGEKVNTNLEKTFENISYSLKGYQEFSVLSKTSFLKNRFVSSTIEIKKNRLKQKIISMLPRHFLECIIIIFICLYISFYQYFENDMDMIIPVLGAFSLAAVRLIPIFNQILSSINILKFSTNSLENINNFLDHKETKIANVMNFNEKFEEINFENVSFSYELSKKNVLHEINLKITNKEFIGIIGESGSGKTTFLNLFLGFIKPTSGRIKINNKNDVSFIENFNHSISYIPQDVTIIKDTILKNIALEENVTSEKVYKIKKIITKLGLVKNTEEINNFLETRLEEFGVNLSGGQRQRVAIARALIHNRKIIILDEVTSSLDRVSEAKFIELLKELKKEITIIIVSHKKDTLKNCERIYEVKNNRFEEINN